MITLFQNRRRRRRRALRWSEYLLLAVGFVCLGWVGYSFGQQWISQDYENYVFDQRLENHPATIAGYVRFRLGLDKETEPKTGEEAPQTEPETDKPQPKVRKIPRGELVGRVEIPRLKIAAMVREGADKKTLKNAVGHVPNTAFPGDPGNVGIAAHRDTFFRDLRGVKMGDRIRLTTSEGTYEYVVDSLKIVYPKNVEVLNPTPDPAITLVTCYPFNYIGHAPQRFIVRAKQVLAVANNEKPKQQPEAGS